MTDQLGELVEGLAFVPKRTRRDDVDGARRALATDGAVIITGHRAEPESAVVATAAVLGTRLRELEQVRERAGVDGGPLSLHRDGAHVRAMIDDREIQVRMPDPDHVAVVCARPADVGGESVTIDAYALIDRIRNALPAMYEFLTSVDVDVTSGVQLPDVQRVPRLCRLVEWTRGGRRMVRDGADAQPAPREVAWEAHRRMIDDYHAVLATLAEVAGSGTRLDAGEVLLIDNYRCLHGVHAFVGTRSVHVLRCRSNAAS